MNLKKLIFAGMFFCLFLNSCAPFSGEQDGAGEKRKFKEVFSWGRPTNGETARKFREIGVTHIAVANEKEARLALQYRMIPCCSVFLPCGPHGQVMTPEEEKLFSYLNGDDLKTLPRKEREKVVDARRTAKCHRYGGEPVTAPDVLNSFRIACFLSDEGLVLSRKKIDDLFAKVPSARGIYLDYLGYTNFKDCRCESCTRKFESAKRKNPSLSREEFFAGSPGMGETEPDAFHGKCQYPQTGSCRSVSAGKYEDRRGENHPLYEDCRERRGKIPQGC